MSYGKLRNLVAELNTTLNQVLVDLSSISSATMDIVATSISISLSANSFVEADASGGEITTTLPAGSEGDKIIVKKVDSSLNNVIVTGSSNIDGGASLELSTQYQTFTLVKGTNQWWIE